MEKKKPQACDCFSARNHQKTKFHTHSEQFLSQNVPSTAAKETQRLKDNFVKKVLRKSIWETSIPMTWSSRREGVLSADRGALSAWRGAAGNFMTYSPWRELKNSCSCTTANENITWSRQNSKDGDERISSTTKKRGGIHATWFVF